MAQDFATEVNNLKGFKREFILSPQQWASLKGVPALTWEEVAFSKGNKDDVPEERGMYCFIIKSNSPSLPSHGYIAYIGITGNTSEKRNLRTRYDDYLRDLIHAKRPLIHLMLNVWKDDIYFAYTVIKDKKFKLNDIETKLLDAVIPPFNQNDFSGNFGKIVKAAWR